MKVVAVLGSPHKNGPSSTIAREVLRGAKDAGHEVVIYELNDMNVRDCQGCKYCKNNDKDCILEDDLKPYWKDLHECGALVVSAPNYCSQVSGGMITYMNRHYCIIGMKDGQGFVRVHPGIKLVGVFAQGSQRDCSAAYQWYLNDFCNRDMVLTDCIVHMGGMPYDADSEIMKHAYETGRNL